MYKPVLTAMWTDVSDVGVRSLHDHWVSNGTYIRNNFGKIVGRVTGRALPVVCYGWYRDKYMAHTITDKVLVERINTYLAELYDIRHTNCSAFAHYVTTGEFVECTQDRMLVLEQGMRPYHMVDKIGVGDMVCLMYVTNRTGSSRKHDFSVRYRRVKKHHHRSLGFGCSKFMKMRDNSLTSEQVKAIYAEGWLDDFHFMVCVGLKEGKPVWLSQTGRQFPGDERVPFSLTVGEHDPYIADVPALACVKKRRR